MFLFCLFHFLFFVVVAAAAAAAVIADVYRLSGCTHPNPIIT